MQGAEGVFIDEAKNVIYPYHYEEGVPTALFMAHIDTVFPDMESMGVREGIHAFFPKNKPAAVENRLTFFQ